MEREFNIVKEILRRNSCATNDRVVERAAERVYEMNRRKKERINAFLCGSKISVKSDKKPDNYAAHKIMSASFRNNDTEYTIYTRVFASITVAEIGNNKLDEPTTIEIYNDYLAMNNTQKISKQIVKAHLDGGYLKRQNETDAEHKTRIENAVSRIIQLAKEIYSDREITISTRPIDFLIMSVTSSWRSCYSALGGEYFGGTLAYAMDDCTAIAYVKRTAQFKSEFGYIDDKIWRMLVHINPDTGYLIYGRQYPFNNDVFANETKFKIMRAMCKRHGVEGWAIKNTSCHDYTQDSGYCDIKNGEGRTCYVKLTDDYGNKLRGNLNISPLYYCTMCGNFYEDGYDSFSETCESYNPEEIVCQECLGY